MKTVDEKTGLIFDERDGTFVYRRPNGEGGFEYSQDFERESDAIAAYITNRLIYTA